MKAKKKDRAASPKAWGGFKGRGRSFSGKDGFCFFFAGGGFKLSVSIV